MTNAVEQAILLLGDMADLKSMKRHEVFLNLKRDLALLREFVSRGRQMELLVSANVSSMRVTNVVPATTLPMPKLEQKSTL